MKLREFDFWEFKSELSESRKFTPFNRSVCAHFERHFELIETDGFYRVIVKLCEDEDERLGTAELNGSVLILYKNFKFSAFNKLGEISKKSNF